MAAKRRLEEEGGERSGELKEWGIWGGEEGARWEQEGEMVGEEQLGVGGGGGGVSQGLLAQAWSGCSRPPIPLSKCPFHLCPA